MQDYGLAYQKRIALFCGYFLLYIAGLLVAVAINGFVNSSSNPIDIVTIMYIFVHSICISSLLLMMVLYGSDYNEMRKEDSLVLIRKQMDLQAQLHHINGLKDLYPHMFRGEMLTNVLKEKDMFKIPDPAPRIKHALEALRTVQTAVEVDNSIHSIKILGFEAGDDLVKTMLGLLVTGLFLAARQLL